VDEERQRLGGRAPGAAADVDCRAATLGNDDLAGRRRLSRGDGTSARGARAPAPVVEHDATDRRGWAWAVDRPMAVFGLDTARIEAWRRAGDRDSGCRRVGVRVRADEAAEPFGRPRVDSQAIDPAAARGAHLAAEEAMPVALRVADAPTVLGIVGHDDI